MRPLPTGVDAAHRPVAVGRLQGLEHGAMAEARFQERVRALGRAPVYLPGRLSLDELGQHRFDVAEEGIRGGREHHRVLRGRPSCRDREQEIHFRHIVMPGAPLGTFSPGWRRPNRPSTTLFPSMCRRARPGLSSSASVPEWLGVHPKEYGMSPRATGMRGAAGMAWAAVGAGGPESNRIGGTAGVGDARSGPLSAWLRRRP